ncbi:LOW QUALITY PROTEIN: reverse transcriptase [Phytophthora megakarya]|uniref:Reverse transcriptase n=1 Tax=Phytophthora megakarya TaxID=4795 RepID=A0A225VW97_9STRA|nr:LOW QUALITY PROTEIN: reverse transcriptase [Phytophthora megakarya]
MCIDYRLLSAISHLLVGFEKALWFMSMDMASGFWAIRMTSQVDFSFLINNCLWGFVSLTPEEEAEVDQEVLDYRNLDPQDDGPPGCGTPVCGTPGCTGCEDGHISRSIPTLADQMTVFKRNIPAPTQMSPVLGRSSYIDDIVHGAPTWNALCADWDALLYRLRYWNISVSLPKSEFGKLSIPYLSHEISAEGIRATPKIAKGVQDLPFPTTMKGVQTFLGSLNYYHKFIDYPVIAASLYELSDGQVRSGRDLSRAKQAFEILKHKIVSTPVLRHPDKAKPFVIVPHANQWTACAVLGQEHDGLIQPVRFTGRVLHDAELRYHIAEKEVIAVLRVLQVFRTLIQGCPLIVYTRHSVLKWIMKSKTADGRCVPWGVLRSQWNLDIRKIQRDEDGLVAILGAGITPREHLDEVAEELIPTNGRAKPPPIISVEMLEDTFEGVVLIFDGAAKRDQASCGCILWKLPGWKILDAQGFILEDVTMNDVEYCGLLNGLTMAQARGVRDLIAVGDLRIVIQQVQGLINSNQPHLQSCEALKAKFDLVRLVHVKWDFNQAADYLTSKTLLLSWSVQEDGERQHLEQVSKIQEKLMKSAESHLVTGHSGLIFTQGEGGCSDIPGCPSALDVMAAPLPHAAKILVAVTRANQPASSEPLDPLDYQRERWRRIRVHQEQDEYLCDLRDFLNGEVDCFTLRRLRKIAKVADLFALDARGVLYRLAQFTRVPATLRDDVLHYAHEDFQGGHQGIKRTHDKLCSEFYWPGMYADVERYVERHVNVCVDCASGKGHPSNPVHLRETSNQDDHLRWSRWIS